MTRRGGKGGKRETSPNYRVVKRLLARGVLKVKSKPEGGKEENRDIFYLLPSPVHCDPMSHKMTGTAQEDVEPERVAAFANAVRSSSQ